MTPFSAAIDLLPTPPLTWTVTGAAGFIGSNLVEALLLGGQRVVGLDDFSTGYRRNLDAVREAVGDAAAERFSFIEGDVCDLDVCHQAVSGSDVVLHQAALGSVPRSIQTPLRTHAANVDGFVNMLVAARDAGVGRFVYASSSSVYGDHPGLPKVEDAIGTPLSPYAVTKRTDELYARTFFDHYGLETVGLRYFNVFGPRQDPAGAYAAVIPRWISTLLDGERCAIHGDGETSRDFCFVANVVQANVRAALAPAQAAGDVYNVAVGDRTTLDELHDHLVSLLVERGELGATRRPAYGPFRAGDVRHSLADISRASQRLGYEPTHTLLEGLEVALGYYIHEARSTV